MGAARFYVRLSNKTWVQQGEDFQPSDFETGSAVAMDPNATVAFVGGAGGNDQKGVVWVLTNDGQGNWTQSGLELTPSEMGNYPGMFGSARSVSDDGETLLVGGPQYGAGKGAAWIFVRLTNGTYIQSQSKLLPTDLTDSGYFGTSVALSSDGSTAIIGGPYTSSSYGGVWVFVKVSNGTFVQQTKRFVPSDVSAEVGSAVALSSDGYTALVGGFGDNGSIGAVWVFCRYGNGSWIQSGTKLVAADHLSSSEQGYALAYSSDASRFIVGGSHDNVNVGAAWILMNRL